VAVVAVSGGLGRGWGTYWAISRSLLLSPPFPVVSVFGDVVVDDDGGGGRRRRWWTAAAAAEVLVVVVVKEERVLEKECG